MKGKGAVAGVLAWISFGMLVSCRDPGVSAESNAIVTQAEKGQAPALDSPVSDRSGSIRSSARVFISGHSLVDRPFPDYLEAISRSMRAPMEWERQYMVGSSILGRTRGVDAPEGEWRGYRAGLNRDNVAIDVLQELRSPERVSGAYDVLLITEQHELLGTLIWNDTVRLLRHYHDQFIAANPFGGTYFYEPWLSLDDKDDPSHWIAYERSAHPVWQCIVAQVNASLALEQRQDRIISIPAGLALAELIAEATSPAGLPGVTQESRRETVDLLINDDVHATEVGAWFVALVSHAAVFRQAPSAVSPPAALSERVAGVLRDYAWNFTSNFYSQYSMPDVSECPKLAHDFSSRYWEYMLRLDLARGANPVTARLRAWKLNWEWRRLLRREDQRNPLYTLQIGNGTPAGPGESQ